MKKVLIRIFVGFFLISSMLTIAPFHIAYASVDDVVEGYNYRIIGYDREYVSSYTLSSGSSTFSGDMTNVVLVERTSNGVTYQTSTASTGGVTGNGGHLSGTLSLNASLSNSTTTYTYRVIEIEVVLTGNFVGYVDISHKLQSSSTYVRDRVYVNGNKAVCSFVDSQSSMTSVVYDLSVSYNLTQFNDNVWTFPVECYPFVIQFMSRSLSIYSINNIFTYELPLFNIPTNNTEIFGVYMPKDIPIDIVMIVNRNLTVNNFFTYIVPDDSTGLSITYNRVITSDIIMPNGANNFRFLHFQMTNADSSRTVLFSTGQSNMQICPIYLSRSTYRHVSTDFALRFDLSNELLDNLNIIANGTSTSNDSSSNLENNTSEMIDNQEDLFGYEDDFNDNMNDALDDIDVNFNIGNTFGSKFLASASWVRQQFDALTSTSPFGSVLSFSLLLGLALLIIGKALK